jgi:hypothetical protein
MSKNTAAKYNLHLTVSALDDALSALDQLLVKEVSGSEQFEARKVNDIYDKVLQAKEETVGMIKGILPPAEPVV